MRNKGTEQVIPHSIFDVLDQVHFSLSELQTASASQSEAGWRLGKHFLESYMLLFAASGEGWLTIDGQFIELRSAAFYIGLPGQLVEAAFQGKDNRGLYLMKFSVTSNSKMTGTSVHEMMKQVYMQSNNSEISCSSPAVIRLLCQDIEAFIRCEAGLKRYYGQIRFQELLYLMFHDMLHVETQNIRLPIEQVKHYIEQHYMEKITIQDMAEAARMSSRHFMRLFKKRYGCSAVDYLTIYRIKQAQIMMRNDHSLRLKEIATCVGFSDEMYFRRKFKQISGVPPATFIRNSKQRIAAVHPLAIGTLLALQVIPCAAGANHPWTAYYRRKYETDTITPLDEAEEDVLQQLETIRPDYIVAVREEMSHNMLQRLKSLAPVCVLSKSNGDWRHHLRTAAECLNLSPAAEVWLQRYEQKAAVLRSQLSEQIRKDTLLVISIQKACIQVMGPHTIASVFYTDLKLKAPEGIEHIWEKQHLHMGDLGDLTPLVIDRAVVIVGENAASRQTWHKLSNSEIWQATKAAKEGSIRMMHSGVLLEYTAFTHDLMLDEVLDLWQHRP
ncbi:AraC-like DNA-binding protein/ABC-type hemin transport system substrate-binding protein [Paenibacillus sp. JGP012]|uniref:AraC family transcriptional regulator n=1 Tax=Paenibacillus sp. JGP012 TaxID=2735914 RepID=UPI0016219CCC|nr:AraC family transcriptional regulator [Paenibacillus sp. JGP012]MBB6022646.1 AraC-like DNA-binding protein/ABC-type hemin transport system substrate-binding protein [Paenibacillus sp. JGP012]